MKYVWPNLRVAKEMPVPLLCKLSLNFIKEKMEKFKL